MPSSKTNPLLTQLISDLQEASREHDAPIWRDIADRLERPNRVWAEVNVSRLQRVLDDGDVAVVPGKLLGTGRIATSVTVGAFQWSKSAKTKVEEAGGEVLRIEDLLEDHPTGTEVRILG